MFSGIVETIGTIAGLEKKTDFLNLEISPSKNFNDIQIGDSISVNGVCLTVTQCDQKNFYVTVVPETLKLTNLQKVEKNSLVNLERSLKIDGRNGGHNVQGHIDDIGKILSIKKDGSEALIVKIQVPDNLVKYIVYKGYITVDGMSLTVIDVGESDFSVTLIPHTQKVTLAHKYKAGDLVNIEVDILGKYIENFLRHRLV